MKAVFKADSDHTVEKQWIGPDAEVPDGWHADKAAALAAWEAPKKAPKKD